MKQKLFMMLAALMLMGTSAMAQSETLKGDVNGDGVVDVADIAAVIQIMHEQTADGTTYYWYAGQENPEEMENIEPILTGDAEFTSGSGWHLLGTIVPPTIRQLVKGGEASKNWYVAVPVTSETILKPVATDMTTLDTSVSTLSTKTFDGVTYQIYWYGGVTGARNTFNFAKK